MQKHLHKNLVYFLIIPMILLTSCGDEALIRVSRMSEPETKALFHGRGRYLIKGKDRDKIIPLKVAVENKSNHTITVKPASIAITDSQVIYGRVKKDVAGITIRATVGGFFLANILGAAAFGAGFGTASAKKNKAILNEISETAFVEPKDLYARSSFKKVMFVHVSDLQNEITLPINDSAYQVSLA